MNEESAQDKRKGTSDKTALPLVSEGARLRFDSDTAESKISEFLARVIPSAQANAASPDPRSALVPWICDVLFSEHSVAGYGRDLAHFARHLQALGVEPLSVTADHVRIYKASLMKAGMRPTTIARRLSVLRGAYRQFAINRTYSRIGVLRRVGHWGGWRARRAPFPPGGGDEVV